MTSLCDHSFNQTSKDLEVIAKECFTLYNDKKNEGIFHATL